MRAEAYDRMKTKQSRNERPGVKVKGSNGKQEESPSPSLTRRHKIPNTRRKRSVQSMSGKCRNERKKKRRRDGTS